MERMIFVNLPVADVSASREFYTGLGFSVNEMFSDAQVTSIVVSDAIVVMIMERDRFADFAEVPIADPRATVQVLNALSASSREEVDTLVGNAVAHGGSVYGKTQEDGPMYGRAVTDPDGHVWEFVHMDMSAVG